MMHGTMNVKRICITVLLSTSLLLEFQQNYLNYLSAFSWFVEVLSHSFWCYRDKDVCLVITIPVEHSVTLPHCPRSPSTWPLPPSPPSRLSEQLSLATGQVTCSRQSSAAIQSASSVLRSVLFVTRCQQQCIPVCTQLCVKFNVFWPSPIYFSGPLEMYVTSFSCPLTCCDDYVM
jgi:hypothetical protein